MKALSIRQPWAWLVVNGHKDVENREWPTRFRGRVYVHAGQTVHHGGFAGQAEVAGIDLGELQQAFDIQGRPRLYRGHLGAIVGEVDIIDCVTRSESPWFEGKYGFVLANPVAYETPIPYKGQLRFFDVAGVVVR